ncbi:M48 family metallopeptidase [Citreicella sp. C3M06]|uniref:M48 family metallopeptidase n=1 Tax=Citreicella sp. C3M06 TaxID=2841564 RepID=UPI001C0939B3|nr:M48 family metallopeptidase [Citreicella sp. C3M06]MBU2959752.1 M48 family metallopeptidase [Citreicella sp. C3M06]
MQGAAHLYDGHSARRHAVTVSLARHDLALRIDGSTLPAPLLWPLADLRRLRDHADADQLVLTRHQDSKDEQPRDAARLVIDDAPLADWLRRTRPGLDRRDVTRGTGRRIALRGTAALAAVALMLFVILPALAGTMARLLPMDREIAFGRSVKAQMERFLGGSELGGLDCTAPEGRAALDEMVTRLTQGQDLGYPLQISVIDHGMVNAFAVPGGQVVLLRGLIEAADSPDGVAAVLAHEIGHVVHRDPTREALRAAGSVGLLGLLLGDVTGGAAIAGVAQRLINASYGQNAESAADAYALDALAQAGLPPSALGDMFEMFRERHGDTSGPVAHFLSHPQLSTRIDAANAAAPGKALGPVLDAAQWQALRNICG